MTLLWLQPSYVGIIVARKDEEGRAAVVGVKVAEGFRGEGYSKILYDELFKRIPEGVALTGALAQTNMLAFREEFVALSDKKSPKYRPDLDLRQRQELALKSTPAWKVRAAAGFTKLVDIVVKDVQFDDEWIPEVTFTVQRESK